MMYGNIVCTHDLGRGARTLASLGIYVGRRARMYIHCSRVCTSHFHWQVKEFRGDRGVADVFLNLDTVVALSEVQEVLLARVVTVVVQITQ